MKHFNSNDFVADIGGDIRPLHALLFSSLDNLREEYSRLEEFVSRNNIEMAKRSVHTMKGVALNFRFEILADILMNVERGLNVAMIRDLEIDVIQKELRNVEYSINKTL